MQHLALPVTAAEDEAVINKLAEDAFWEPHQAAWVAAYQAYHANGGSPFAVHVHHFNPEVRDEQYALYDSRKGSGVLKRMRQKQGLKSCPVCGSPVTGSLDHYLPRDTYPEFSIMRANLIPACIHCNSGSKGITLHGRDPRRFIHPYYDTWASGDLWFVEVIPPYKAARFKPRPLAGLSAPQDEIVTFHLENVLGSQFQLSMGGCWSSFPGLLKIRDPDLTSASVRAQFEQELRVARHTSGANSWAAALLRGILAENDVVEHLRQEAIGAPVPPIA